MSCLLLFDFPLGYYPLLISSSIQSANLCCENSAKHLIEHTSKSSAGVGRLSRLGILTVMYAGAFDPNLSG